MFTRSVTVAKIRREYWEQIANGRNDSKCAMRRWRPHRGHSSS